MTGQTADELIVAVTTNRLDFANIVQNTMRSHYRARNFKGNILTACCNIERRPCFELEGVIAESHRLAEEACKQRPEAIFGIGSAFGETSLAMRSPYTKRRLRVSFGIVVLIAATKEGLAGCAYKAPDCPKKLDSLLIERFDQTFGSMLKKDLSRLATEEHRKLGDDVCLQLSSLNYNSLACETEYQVH